MSNPQQQSAVQDEQEDELLVAVEWLEYRKNCAEEELFAAIRELEDYRRTHAKCEVF